MITHNLNPVLLSIGPFEVRYYGLFFVLGFIFAYFILNHLSKTRSIDLSKDDIIDYLIYVIIGTIIGARLFYVLIYNLPFYLENPADIFAVWKGGLSFHGGFIGAIASLFFYCKKKKVKFYTMLDISVIPLALGLSLGRIGNFINGELPGRVSNVPWAVKFPDYDGFRHPSQIYASIKDLVIFFVLWAVKDRKLPPGLLFWSFVVMYSIFRFTVEFFRAPDPQLGFVLGFLSIGQILSIIMFSIGAFMFFRVSKKV